MNICVCETNFTQLVSEQAKFVHHIEFLTKKGSYCCYFIKFPSSLKVYLLFHRSNSSGLRIEQKKLDYLDQLSMPAMDGFQVYPSHQIQNDNIKLKKKKTIWKNHVKKMKNNNVNVTHYFFLTFTIARPTDFLPKPKRQVGLERDFRLRMRLLFFSLPFVHSVGSLSFPRLGYWEGVGI